MSILNWLSRGAGARDGAADADARIHLATELAVLGIDARLRLVTGYASRLLPAVTGALAHCSALAASIPGPIDLLPGAWSKDAGLRALFVNAAAIDELLGRSLELRTFAAQPADAAGEYIWALISVLRTEQAVLGWASHGDLLHKDAAQRTVSFSRHRLLVPSACEADLRREIASRAYEHMVVDALGCLSRSNAAQRPRGRIGALLRERLLLLQRTRSGLEALRQPPVADEPAFHALRQQLIENGRQLAFLDRRSDSLEQRLARVVEVLGNPAGVIGFGKIEDRLTSLNLVAGGDAPAAAELHLAEISAMGAQPYARATAIVRLSPHQLKPRAMELSSAEHWL